MTLELLTPDEMTRADRLAIEGGPASGVDLMRRAGEAVAGAFLRHFPEAAMASVLCGPGNNGGDGYVAARLLRAAGVAVELFADAPPRGNSDAAVVAGEAGLPVRPFAAFRPDPASVVIDAVYGAGLSKPLSEAMQGIVGACKKIGQSVLAVDLPSGVSGASGKVLGAAFEATITVTFARRKPGHLLYPGRAYCGRTIVADIGISDAVIASVGATTFANSSDLWRDAWPELGVNAHKYSRGHVAVFSGGPTATGAARLSAIGAARIGAGAVTMLSPENALAANAAHLTSVILREAGSAEEVLSFLTERKPAALVFGPGLGPHAKVGRFLIDLLPHLAETTLVVDADGLTSAAKQAADFLAATRATKAKLVMTPHEGEFGRLFAEIAADDTLSKLDKARKAAAKAAATIVYKGPDTVIASPDGRAVINENGTPLLATAGSGDVLSGLIAGLAAQHMPAFEAACAAVWIHAEAATRFGRGLIAEDLPGMVPAVLRELTGETNHPAAPYLSPISS